MFSQLLKLLPVLCLTLSLAACNGVPPTEDDVDNGPDVGDVDDDGIDQDSDTGDGDGLAATALTIGGRIDPAQSAKSRPQMQAQTYPYTVVAQSNETGETYRAETDDLGDFEIELPDDEEGHSFVVTILGPDGRAVGPVIFEQQGDEGTTGLALDRAADLGTIDLPDDPTQAVIQPGTENDVADLLDSDLAARLNEHGVPVGLATFGKGHDAVTEADPGTRFADRDGDGLIDIFDADDDGDGTIDDFDGEGDPGGIPSDLIVNFFMNLKIDVERAPTYYTGTSAEISAVLAQDTVITFECMTTGSATTEIASARLLETPGPAYLPTATLLADGGGPATLWQDVDYAFTEVDDRFEAFAVPNAEMTAGDSFTLEITFTDGTLLNVVRMINFVFKNIPTLVNYGVAGSLTAFDINDPIANGTPSKPISFDGTQDLTLEFMPPPDETGMLITGMDYNFTLFYNDESGNQIDNIDFSATWPTPADDNHEQMRYYLEAAELGALPVDDTYTVTLPNELFPDVVTLDDASTANVGSFKIDITAESPSGNASIMLSFVKE